MTTNLCISIVWVERKSIKKNSDLPTHFCFRHVTVNPSLCVNSLLFELFLKSFKFYIMLFQRTGAFGISRLWYDF